jgi:peptide/nickel transport system ATP-binding protein
MLLEVDGLSKHFHTGRSYFGGGAEIRAVSNVSFQVGQGETFAIVGESGCGKSTLAKLILMLEDPTAGTIRFDGKSYAEFTAADRRALRRNMQTVFQDPYASLNPRLKVWKIIAEPILASQKIGGRALRSRVEEMLDVVGLPSTAADLYPHEFSGGQRQRIAVARALSVRPRFLVLDEPTSALDVSIRAQILNLLMDIQKDYDLTYLIIAHDLALVEHFSHRIGIMYLGEMVESGPTEQVFGAPDHPYTQALLASVLRPDPGQTLSLDAIKGDIPSPIAPPSGCKFRTRCRHAFDRCAAEPPEARTTAPGHWATCHLLETEPA